MSGREPEPVAAFFPSIDRNLIRDLDRHLRNAAPQADPPSPRPAPARPSTSDILEAVEQAASSMGTMNSRIHDLETRNQELEATNVQLRAKLGELLQGQQAFDVRLRAENERAVRAEQVATHHASRSQVLERDLETALGDLTRIAEAITGTLGASALHHE